MRTNNKTQIFTVVTRGNQKSASRRPKESVLGFTAVCMGRRCVRAEHALSPPPLENDFTGPNHFPWPIINSNFPYEPPWWQVRLASRKKRANFSTSFFCFAVRARTREPWHVSISSWRNCLPPLFSWSFFFFLNKFALHFFAVVQHHWLSTCESKCKLHKP